MGAAVEDIHHGDRQNLGVRAAEILVKRESELCRRSARDGHRDAKDGVGAKLLLGRGAIKLAHHFVDGDLVEGVVADEFGSNVVGDITDSLENTLAKVASLGSVAQFDGLMLTRGGSAWNGGAPNGSACEMDIGFECGIAAGIEDLAGVDGCDGGVVHGSEVFGQRAVMSEAEEMYYNTSTSQLSLIKQLPRQGQPRR